MKKVTSILTILSAPVIASAQTDSEHFNMDVFQVCSMIFTVALFMLFILTIIRRTLEYRLKNKIVEKGIPENIAASVLQTNSQDDSHATIKWFFILMGLGAGLTIVHYTTPLGIHSLAIMAFSIAVSFLGYFLFIRFAKK